MSISPLAAYVDSTPSLYESRKYAISRITIHHAKGNMSLEDFSSASRTVPNLSWNYAIDSAGGIGSYVAEDKRAFSSSDSENDHRSVSIFVASPTDDEDESWSVSSSTYIALLLLCEDICRRNNITELTYDGTAEGSNLTSHSWFIDTSCPGPYVQSRLPLIAASVTERLNSRDSLPNEANAVSDALLAYDYLTIQDNAERNQQYINTEVLNPYIVTLDRQSRVSDYTELKSFGVVGAFVEAGQLYDSAHIVRSYRNPNLKSQIASLDAAELPYGLYTIVAAKSVEEADLEIKEFISCLRLHPPKLGAWLHLSLSKSKYINDTILDRYYTRLSAIGYADSLGIYADQSQLSQISWDKQCDKFYLWLNKHVQSQAELDDTDNLLTPDFFDVV